MRVYERWDSSKLRLRIRQLRVRECLNCKLLSERCGLPSGAIRRYESGESVPTLYSIIKIADHFDVSVDFLLGREKNYCKCPRKDTKS